MAIDIQKSFKVAIIPIAALIGIGIVREIVFVAIGAIPFLGLILCAIGPLFGLLSLLVLAWAGYKSVKEAQMDIVGGAVTGAIAGVIGGIVDAVINFAFVALGLGAGLATGGDMVGAGIGAAIGVIGLIIGLVFAVFVGLVMGAIFGAAGAFVAGMKK